MTHTTVLWHMKTVVWELATVGGKTLVLPRSEEVVMCARCVALRNRRSDTEGVNADTDIDQKDKTR